MAEEKLQQAINALDRGDLASASFAIRVAGFAIAALPDGEERQRLTAVHHGIHERKYGTHGVPAD